ncbi:MAG: hypothetical protein GEU91_19865 [Rhizobiales bacterium]|nr:hypothetical protein [Hyphomicrobiales bacterium]
MCDYSLQHIASRPAQVGDKLVSSRFDGTISRGFSAAGDPNVAVCLLPGTEIAFEKDVEYENSATYRREHVPMKVARFRQLNTNQPLVHHDALEFPGGETVLLTRLVEGQCATVLQLPAHPKTAEEAAEQTRVPIVA